MRRADLAVLARAPTREEGYKALALLAQQEQKAGLKVGASEALEQAHKLCEAEKKQSAFVHHLGG